MCSGVEKHEDEEVEFEPYRYRDFTGTGTFHHGPSAKLSPPVCDSQAFSLFLRDQIAYAKESPRLTTGPALKMCRLSSLASF